MDTTAGHSGGTLLSCSERHHWMMRIQLQLYLGEDSLGESILSCISEGTSRQDSKVRQFFRPGS